MRFSTTSLATCIIWQPTGVFTPMIFGPQYFYNYGTFRKSAGTNSAVSSVLFDNMGGTVDVESGTLTLANNGSSSNGL